MRIDGIRLREGSDVVNLTVTGGTSFPASPSAGELFFRTDAGSLGLHQYNGTGWEPFAQPVTVSAGSPAAPLDGDLWYDTVNADLLVYVASGPAWTPVVPDNVGQTLVVIVGATSVTAVKATQYVLTNVAPTTVTLPAGPAVGDEVVVSASNGLASNVVNRAGSNIMGLAENCTLDRANVTYHLRYVSATLGWIFT